MGRWADAARKKAAAIHAVGAMLTDEQAISTPAFFMPWRPMKPDGTPETYAAGDRRTQDGILYKCLQAHTAQADWAPDIAVSLWARIDDPAIEWPEWIQPDSTNPYPEGAKVTYNGKHYISTIDNNVWSPDTYPAGWEQV